LPNQVLAVRAIRCDWHCKNFPRRRAAAQSILLEFDAIQRIDLGGLAMQIAIVNPCAVGSQVESSQIWRLVLAMGEELAPPVQASSGAVPFTHSDYAAAG